MSHLSKILLSFSFLAFSIISLSAQSPIGVWKTIDDNTGEAKSHIEIYEVGDKLHGKIVKLLRKPADTVCDNCKGAKKGQLLMGMDIIEAMEAAGDEWEDGTIMDPENGKVYKCKMVVEEDGRLRVRGYIGFEALGRNQYWDRVN